MSKIVYFSTPSNKRSSLFDILLKKLTEQETMLNGEQEKDKPIFFGVDWAKGSGCNRGDVIARVDNVIYVRFKAVDFKY